MLKREPAVIIAAVAALIQAIMIYFTDDPGADVEWVVPAVTVAVTLLAGLVTRGRVFSERTVRDAGFTPREMQKRAADPSVRSAMEDEG